MDIPLQSVERAEIINQNVSILKRKEPLAYSLLQILHNNGIVTQHMYEEIIYEIYQ